jgi:hypothetical protein
MKCCSDGKGGKNRRTKEKSGGKVKLAVEKTWRFEIPDFDETGERGPATYFWFKI